MINLNIKLVENKILVQTSSNLPKQSTFVICLTEETYECFSKNTSGSSVMLYKELIQLNALLQNGEELTEDVFEHLKHTLMQLPSTVETVLIEWSEQLEGKSLAIAWALCHHFNLSDGWVWELGRFPNRKLLALFNHFWRIGWKQNELNQKYNNLNFMLMHQPSKLNLSF